LIIIPIISYILFNNKRFFAILLVGLKKIRTFAKGNDDYCNNEYYLEV